MSGEAGEGAVHAIQEAGSELESALNLVLLVPLGVSLALGLRRIVVPLLIVALFPALIELAQLGIPGRVSSLSDFLLNALGGVIGVGLGATVLSLSRRAGAREARG